jgi:hypothetical protein
MAKTKLPKPRIPEGQLKQMAFEKQRLKEMMEKLKDSRFGPMPPPVKGGTGTGRPIRKAFKKGGFPDFSGDGKITRKDILMGQGAIPKPKKKMKRGGMAKKKRVKKAVGGLSAGIKALRKAMARKKTTKGGGQDASTIKPSGPSGSGAGGRTPRDAMTPARRKKMMGGGMMKKRMKRGGRAMKRGGGMMKKRMKRGGRAR